MLWIGLTGGIASGKSTVAGFFKKAGIPVTDADKLARLAVRPGHPAFLKIVDHFGQELLDPDGHLNRKKLGSLVFTNPSERAYLESLIHPFVQDQVRQARCEFAEAGHLFGIYDVPLLFEKNLQDQFDRVIVVGCSKDLQMERLMQRSSLNEAESLLRIQNQIPLEEKMKQATDLIWNETSLEDLALQVERLIQKFRALPSHESKAVSKI